MRTLPGVIFLLLAAPLLRALEPARKEAPEQKTMLRYRVDLIDLDVADLRQIIAQTPASPDDSELRRKALELVQQQRGVVAQSLSFAFIPDHKYGQQSALEIPYGTDFDPGGTASDVTGPLNGPVELRTPSTITTFATRDAGMSIELNGDLRGGAIDTTANIGWTQRLQVDVWGQDLNALEQPRFYNMLYSGRFWHVPGQWRLVGVFVPPSENGAAPGSRRRVLFIKALALSGAPPLQIAKEELKWKQTARFVLESFSLPADRADSLLGRDELRRDAERLWKEAQALLAEKQATLGHYSVLTTGADDGKGALKSVEEVFYPGDFDPPQYPAKIRGLVAPEVRLAVPAIATSFENTNAGPVFEVETTLEGQDELPAVRAVFTDAVYAGRQTRGAGLAAIQLANFRKARLSTETSLRDGAIVLLGVQDDIAAAADASPRRVLYFLRTNLIPLIP